MNVKARFKSGNIERTKLENVNRVEIEFNGDKFTITESVDKKLTINKISHTDLGNDCITVYSRYSNEIEIQ